jgi:hypothetical protein
MFALRALLATLLLTHFVAAEEHVSFPTEDGGVVYADIYGKANVGLCSRTGAASTRKAGKSRLEHSRRRGFEF